MTIQSSTGVFYLIYFLNKHRVFLNISFKTEGGSPLAKTRKHVLTYFKTPHFRESIISFKIKLLTRNILRIRVHTNTTQLITTDINQFVYKISTTQMSVDNQSHKQDEYQGLPT